MTQSEIAARAGELVDQAWVLAALAAAADGRPLGEEHGALLGAAGYAERGPDGWRLTAAYRAGLPGGGDAATAAAPSALPRRVARILRQAADAAEGRPPAAEEDEQDDAVLLAEGRASAARLMEFLDGVAAQVPEVDAALRRGGLRFLDVGTGVGAIAAAVARRVPDARAVGLDIRPRLLRLAEDHLTRAGVRDRVEPRLLDVAELTDTDAYDLAWLPLAVLTPEAAAAALHRVRAALRPDGWLVSATAIGGSTDGPAGSVREAVIRWRSARRDSTSWSAAEVAERLTAAGYREVRRIATPPGTMAVVVARAAG